MLFTLFSLFVASKHSFWIRKCSLLKMQEEGKEMSEEEKQNKYGSSDNTKYLAFKVALAPYFTNSALGMVHHCLAPRKIKA
jgi:plasmid replication initiation protein